ncbi:MAG: hypothetical protein AB8E15_13555 [Bdellovibrionales bacterium]
MRSYYLFLFLIISACATVPLKKEIWKNSEKVLNPESIYFDRDSNYIFVSNIVGGGVEKDQIGYISKLDRKGRTLKTEWVSGLNAPKGMRAHKGNLWVTDIDSVLVIDIKKSKIIKRINIKKAKFLNDIAISPEGIVYVSDTISSKIHVIKNFKSSIFMEGSQLESPNGLLYLNDKLYVASWGLTKDWTTKTLGRLYAIDISTKNINYITKNPLGNLDGLEKSKDGDFLVSDWVAGKVYNITNNGQVSLVFKGSKGLADIGYVQETDTILIPYMQDNSVFSIRNSN